MKTTELQYIVAADPAAPRESDSWTLEPPPTARTSSSTHATSTTGAAPMAANSPIICAQWGAPLFGNAATVILQQDGIDRFTVTYGKQVRRGLSYARAGNEFGLCVMHAAACDGHLDNRGLAEARKEKDMRVNAESIA